MIPHDYYHDEEAPIFSCKDNSRPYLEPDWLACGHNDVLPIVSTIGRGPRGAGIEIEVKEDSDGSYVLVFKNDETGEQILETPNLSAGKISISAVPEHPAPGETVKVSVDITQGTSVETYEFEIPSGADGTRIYTCDDTLERNEYDLGSAQIVNLEGHDTPRVNDLVICRYVDGETYGICIGHITSIDNEMATWQIDSYFEWKAQEIKVEPPLTLTKNGNIITIGLAYDPNTLTVVNGALTVISKIFPQERPELLTVENTIEDHLNKVNEIITLLIKSNAINHETIFRIPYKDLTVIQEIVDKANELMNICNQLDNIYDGYDLLDQENATLLDLMNFINSIITKMINSNFFV